MILVRRLCLFDRSVQIWQLCEELYIRVSNKTKGVYCKNIMYLIMRAHLATKVLLDICDAEK